MKYWISALAGLLLVACADEKQPKSLRITGNVEGFKRGTLYIKGVADTAWVTMDSIRIDGDSHFVSDIDLKSPEMLHLFMDRGATNSIDNSLMFFAEPGKMHIETSLDQFYSKARITGSKNHDLYEEFKKIDSRFKNQLLEITEAHLKAMQEQKPFDQEDAARQADIITKRRYLSTINFAVNHKDHEVAPYLALAQVNKASLPYLDTIYNSLTPGVAGSKYGKLLKSYIAERRKAQQP
jgi:hypothetical protein